MLILMTDGWGISSKIALRWIPLDLTDDMSTLVQVMAWCRQASSHYLSQCWSRSQSPYGVTRPQWVNSSKRHDAFMCWWLASGPWLVRNNGLSHIWHQAITWTNADFSTTDLLGTYISEILVDIQRYSFKEVPLNRSSVRCWPFSRPQGV